MQEVPQTRDVLLIEGNREIRNRVRSVLVEVGYRVTSVVDLDRAMRQLASQRHDAVIVALEWPMRENSRRIRLLRRAADTTPLLLLCDSGDVTQAVNALRHGADDYMLRPPDAFELRTRLARVLERRDLDSRIAFFQDELSKKSTLKTLEASSPSMRAVLGRVLRVAPMRSTVLISGESGVGKELVARSIHFNSPRRDRPFIALNCAAMPGNLIETELFGHEKGAFTGAHARARGKFEIAHEGTLFLDEIGEMAPNTQAKLLRVMEQREFMRVGGDRSVRVDVRLIAATNADLERMVAERRFRRDLYYRLKVVTITVPPLRERREDIPHLIEIFLDELARENAVPPKRIDPAAMAALETYHWPGNVRELKNLLESVLVAIPGGVIDLEDLPTAMRPASITEPGVDLKPGTTLAAMERELIHRTLVETGGNRTHSAALLGIGVRTLQRKLRSYGIDVAPTRRRSRRGGRQRG